jgi:hypothetical protein
MADTLTADAPAGTAPLTEDAFLADRQKFWGWFTGLVAKVVVGIVVLLILLTIFLV